MSEKNDINTKYTFWELLSEYRVIVPIIQRDYAQGRTSDNASAIRADLLESIYTALISKKSLDFDFVYGTVEENDDHEEVLYPLDGQQRLTTFFLLHWYLAQKEGYMEDASGVLSRFTYQTRISSREFCELLMEIEYEPEAGISVSDYIKNENGYFREWDTDPTISHMLTMLDAIHEKFFEAEELFELLISDDVELLTFSFLEMKHYALTDDLYIKMNARGKALSVFENFKAKFIQHLKEHDLPYDYFEENIDMKWTDLLWDYRDRNNTIDDQFMNLFCFITEMLFLETSEPREGDSPFRPNKIRGLIDYYQDEDSVNDLYAYLDLWANKEEASAFLESIFTTDDEPSKVKLFENRADIFSAVVNGENVSLPSKLLLFSVMKRLVYLEGEVDIDQFKDFIRIVRNLILNYRSFIRKKCSYSSDLRYGRHAIPIMQNFIDFLADEEDAYSGLIDYEICDINSEALELERQKARIIREKPEKKELIHNLEDLELFRSSIFNIIPYIEENDDEYLVENLKLLSEYHGPKMIQALLSIRDYGIRTGSSMYGDRCFYGYEKNWYSIFSYAGGENHTQLICRFVEQFQNTESTHIGDCLDEIISENLPKISKSDWRYTIVKYYNTVRNYPHILDHPYFILAKENCSDGSTIVHRINGFIMNGYHAVPDYFEIKAKLGKICSGDIRSMGCDLDNEGRIRFSHVGGLTVSYNNEGSFTCLSRQEDNDWIHDTVEKFNSINKDEMDKVEKCVLLCQMLDDKSNDVYGDSDSDDGTNEDFISQYFNDDDLPDDDQDDSSEEPTTYTGTSAIGTTTDETVLYKDFMRNLLGEDVELPENFGKVFEEQVNSLTHEKARAVVWKMWKEGKSAQEISKEMSITTQYVYNLRDRGLRMLRHSSRCNRLKQGLTNEEALNQIKNNLKPDSSIDVLELSIPVYNVLRRAGIDTIGDVEGLSQNDLLQINNLGKAALNEVVKKLYALGLRLKDD